MRRLILGIGALTLIVVGVPVIAPVLGLSWHRQSLPPAGERRVAIFGRTLDVSETPAAGPVVLLVHGVPGSRAMMLPLAGALSELGLRVVSYDRAGWVHSEARPVDEPANPTSNARDLAALIDALRLEQPVVVGYSYGGGVVQELNRIDAASTACNVLLSSTGNGVAAASRGFLNRIVFSRTVMAWLLATTPVARRVSNASMNALFAPDPVPEPMRLQLIATLEASVSTWVREGSERYQDFAGYAPSSIRVPTLVIHGAEDAVVPVAIAERLAGEITGAELSIEPGGHALVLTSPERIAMLIVDFVQRRCST